MRIFLLVLSTVLLTSCFEQPKKNVSEKPEQTIKNTSLINSKKDNDIEILRNSEGKYPHELDLFNDYGFRERLKKIVGNNQFNFLLNHWDISHPIEMKRDIYVIEGCEKHNCDWTNFIITYDNLNKYMSIGIRNEKIISVYFYCCIFY